MFRRDPTADLIWSEPVLRSILLPPVLRGFAKGLRQAMWGWGLIAVGGLMTGLIWLPGAPIQALSTVGLLSFIAGAMMITWSKMSCFEFAAPIASRWAISLAFWLDVAAIGLRFTGRQLGFGGPTVKLAAAVCGIASAFFFVYFLHRLTELIHERRLRLHARLVLGAGTIALFSFLGFIALMRPEVDFGGKMRVSLALGGLLAVAGIVGIISYGRLLSGLSFALDRFATFVEQQDETSEDEEQAEEEFAS